MINFTGKPLEPTFQKVKAKLMGILADDNPDSVALSCDGWSAMHHGYFGINVHYFREWKRVIFHVCCQPMDESHTGANIRGSMEEHLTE